MLWPLNSREVLQIFLEQYIKLVGYVDFLLNDLVCNHDNKRGMKLLMHL